MRSYIEAPEAPRMIRRGSTVWGRTAAVMGPTVDWWEQYKECGLMGPIAACRESRGMLYAYLGGLFGGLMRRMSRRMSRAYVTSYVAYCMSHVACRHVFIDNIGASYSEKKIEKVTYRHTEVVRIMILFVFFVCHLKKK